METDKKFNVSVGALVFLAIVAGVGGYYVFQKNKTVQTTQAVTQAYGNIGHRMVTSNDDPKVVSALQAFRDVAADESNSNVDRANALNGINYAYTQANFDATNVYEVVFSKPPFSQYYVAPTASSTDPLHPESGGNVAAVEEAIAKLNELSNSLSPNHFAITRLEVGTTNAYQRAAAKIPASERPALQKTYATKVKDLIAQYDALPPLESVQSQYPTPMLMQLMLVHATALAFVGNTFKDQSYLDKGEASFKKLIALGDAYPATNNDIVQVINQQLLARIFYASSYWAHYAKTDPEHIRSVLRPINDVKQIKDTAVYRVYLPSHKDATVAPFNVLRTMAKQMPNLKKLLVELGWKF